MKLNNKSVQFILTRTMPARSSVKRYLIVQPEMSYSAKQKMQFYGLVA